ncbi:MAG: ABC transporter permease [Zavarzinia sp.]|nr:ABC transporter permease [Zavarzinia sp.]
MGGNSAPAPRRAADPDLGSARRRSIAGVPAVLFVLLLFVYPLSEIVALGFRAPGGGFSLQQYEAILTSPLYQRVIMKTLWLSASVTLIDVLLAYPLAVALSWSRGWTRGLILIAIMAPFWTNLLVRAYGWIVLLHPGGLVNQGLMAAGLTDRPIEMVHQTSGVLIGMTQIMLPYMVLPIASQI